jgi:tetratricopeptide (TPR) repeat protein
VSLLLDALKRAEDAKRAKAEAATTQATPAETAPETAPADQPNAAPALSEPLTLAEEVSPTRAEPKLSETDASPPPEFPVLSLEVVDDRPDDPVAKSSSNPAAAPLRSSETAPTDQAPRSPVTAPQRMTLEEMLATELGNSDLDKLASPAPTPTPPATAAFRASRLPPAQSPAELLASYSTAPSLEPLASPKPSDDLSTPMTKGESPQQALNREAVKNVFAVKQAATSSGGKAKWALPIAGVLLAVIGSGGWYVWNEMNRLSKPVARLPVPPLPPAAVATPAPAPAPTDSASRAPIASAPEPSAAAPSVPTAAAPVAKTVAAPEEAPLPPLLPPPATQLKEERAPAATKIVVATPREALARQIEALPVPPTPNGGNNKVMLRPGRATVLEINPALAAGYAALAAGDYVTAKQRYAEAIAANSHSADAHLGFATAAARSGNATDLPLAIKHYQRVLEIDPRNATASAALIVLAGGKDGSSVGDTGGPGEKEMKLKLLIAQDPSAANAHFLLGNLYAESRQWREAQPAYFEAARLMPQNADYNYNLAVSLDQLGQGAAAINFYRRALAANVKGQFERAAVERRISALSAASAEGPAKR